jgi:hypothetical protein
MDNLNQNLINLIASFKKTGQSDEVIKQSLWQLGMIPEMVESHLDYYNKHTAQINKDINIVKETKDMKLTLEKLHTQSEKTIAALEEMKSDNSLGFSASNAQRIIENGLAQLQITKDDKTVMEEKIKAGYKIDDTLVNPVLKYTVTESLYTSLTQYDWLQPVADFRGMIAESFVADKWSYVAANFANSLAGQSSNPSYAHLYESLVDVLIDEENVRLALKDVLLENSWHKDCKSLLSSIVAEEKAEQGEINTSVFENSNCSVRKTISPLIIDENKKVFFLNGKNYIFDGNTLEEATVTDQKYNNVLEGLALLKYEADKDRLVYYGKNNMVLEYSCQDDKISLTGIDNVNEMSIIDLNETLKRCGIFDRETIGNCEKLVKFFEAKDILVELDSPITTVQSDKFAGVFVTVINVTEGVYVNKVNVALGINEMTHYKTAKEACDAIRDFMKYDATAILSEKLQAEGIKNAVIESKRNEIKETLSFLSEKRAELIAGLQETNNNEQVKEALDLVEGEIRKFEKELQETYVE